MTRVAEELNRTLHELLDRDQGAYVLGEDIADPYGGAFRITKGLSTRFPGRVRTTPISEAAFSGVAGGLALFGHTVVVELMFADFVALAFDQIVNFVAKSVSMYGTRTPMRVIFRCPSGGRRGYGPTHSQSLHKHFIGVPDLDIHELSALHPTGAVFDRMLAAGRPCLFVEDKSLYGEHLGLGRHDDLFRVRYMGEDADFAVVSAEEGDPDVVLVAPGGMVGRALDAARRLLITDEITATVVVPSRLHPFDPWPIAPLLDAARLVGVVEESTAGGTWGAEVAARLRATGRWRQPVLNVHSRDSVIPAAPHLEERVVVRAEDIYEAMVGVRGV